MADVLQDYAPFVARVEVDPGLDDVCGAIVLVASGAAASVMLVNLRHVEDLVDAVMAEARRAGVVVRIDRGGSNPAIVVSSADR